MKLTYIFHSGFVLETEQCVLVFDYWMDPANVMSRYQHTSKQVYVFSSHFHEDHFTREIFNWKNGIPNITYILSKDILKHRRSTHEEADVWMAKGAVWENEHLKVVATGSNDSGVSWVIDLMDESSTNPKRIFHAGDLCNWYARFLADNTSEIIDEFDENINPVAEEKRFLGELKDIRKITEKFDIVMFPVDGRIGNGYTLGARQFIDRFKVNLFVPMHFVASGFESAWRMEPFCKEKDIPFWCIKEEGETFEYE